MIGVVVAAACIWDALAQGPLTGPIKHWVDIRTARCVAAGRGVDLYAGADSPALDGHIYGPVGYWMCSPASLASDPASAIRIATALSALFLLIPSWMLLAQRRRGESRESLLGLQALFVTWLCSYWMIYPGAILNPHVDAQAICLMGLACWAAFGLAADPRNYRLLAVASLAAGAAVWTKQTAAPILLFAPAVLWSGGHRREALRTAAFTLASCVAWGLAAGAVHGFEDVALATLRLPGAHAWRWDVLFLEPERVAELWGPAMLCLVAAALYRAGARLPQRGLALAALATALTPFGIAGRVKVQGFSNNFLAPMFFFALAAAVAAAETARDTQLLEQWRRWARAAVAFTLCLLVVPTAGHLVTRRFERSQANDRSRSEQAASFSRSHPGQAYFPTRPLATLFAEGRWYSTGQALRTRKDAGFEAVELELPPDLRYIVLEQPDPDLMNRFPEFELRELPELTGWSVYVRPDGDAQ